MGYPKYHRQMLANPYYIELVAKLRQARETAGLFQFQVARAIGVTETALSSWERMRTIPATHHLVKWLQVVQIEVKEKEA